MSPAAQVCEGEPTPRSNAPAIRLDALSDVTEPAALEAVFGPIRAVERSPLDTVGFSRSEFERLTVRLPTGSSRHLILKRTRLSCDWLAYRTHDRWGREASLLTDPAFSAVWEIYASPYLAFAVEEDSIGLLMEDLSEHLFPNVREPIEEKEEETLLHALVRLHARFWQSPALERPWLVQPSQYLHFLGPGPHAHADLVAPPPPEVHEKLWRGWAVALDRLPEEVTRTLLRPAEQLADRWADLPRTLLHGDAKVANFAILPEGGVAAFDWANVGTGPATFDLGWYLAVNASRLPRPKEVVIACYRSLLEDQLEARISQDIWERMLHAGILCGALMLLWWKTIAMEEGKPGAAEEWEWWREQLEAACDA